MQNQVFPSSASVYRALNRLSTLSAKMQEEDPEHALPCYRVGLTARELLYVALNPPTAKREEVRA